MKAETASGPVAEGRRPAGRTTPIPLAAPGEGGLTPAAWAVLDAAAEEVATRWPNLPEETAAEAEVRSTVDALVAAVRHTALGEMLDESAGLPRTVLGRRALTLLRRCLLRVLQTANPSPPAADALHLLQAFEAVHQAIEPDWSQHFADRLSGPDGLELVVEVAHDLRSPLTSILFLAETLKRGRSGAVNEVQERQLGLIYSAAFGLSSMASDVIELARGGDRLVDLDPIPFSVTDIFESVRDIVQPIAEEKGLTVRLHQPDLDFRVGHPVALSRVLLNLTTNALKFTSEGYVEVTGTDLGGSTVEFAVHDTGRGISPQGLNSLFQPFRRRQKPGEYAFSGAGLGLSICRKLVEAMGSELQVETSPETGTRFIFRLQLPSAGHPGYPS